MTIAGALTQPAARLLIADVAIIDPVNNVATASAAGGNIGGEVLSAIGCDGTLAFNNNVLPSMSVWNKR